MDARRTMVERHLRARGIRDPRVLSAMGSVPREAFLPPELCAMAYDDRPLPIAGEQTISQPYIVALMTEALDLEGHERALEIGTGSGYAAAILGRVAAQVDTIERIEELATTAAKTLAEQGFSNVHVHHADGTLGWPAGAPYDAIVVAAAGPDLPRALLDQLAIGGRLVMPVGDERDHQRLLRVTRVSEHDYRREDLGAVIFVPLIGAQGWAITPGGGRSRCGAAS